MSLTFKLLSLAIRTAAKPIGNYIKRQTKEHEGFRRFAVLQAQRVHWVDMRMRLGILHDATAQDRMHERERKREEEKKKKAELPTVRNEEEQRKWVEELSREQAREGKKEEKERSSAPKIRPLSEAKAIELGANFFSEAFIFAVAAGLLVWDSWRSRRKESARRDDVAERLENLETELERMQLKYEPNARSLPEKSQKAEIASSWYDPRSWWTRTDPQTEASDADEELEKLSSKPTVKLEPGSIPKTQPASTNSKEESSKESKNDPKSTPSVAKVVDQEAAKEPSVEVKSVVANSKTR